MIYRDKSFPLNLETAMTESMAKTLSQLFGESGVNPLMINVVTEFGCGNGRTTRAILNVCPAATVQVIDINNVLDPDLRSEHRVKFFQGKFVNVLKRGGVVPADVVVLYHSGSGHGFNQHNLSLLVKAVGQGVLITGGHLGPLFDDSFLGKFTLIKSHNTGGLTADIVWRAK